MKPDKRQERQLTIAEITNDIVSRSPIGRAREASDGPDRVGLQQLKMGLNDADLYRRLYDRSIGYEMNLRALNPAEARFKPRNGEKLPLSVQGAKLDHRGWIIPGQAQTVASRGLQRESRPQSAKGLAVVGRGGEAVKGFDISALPLIELHK